MTTRAQHARLTQKAALQMVRFSCRGGIRADFLAIRDSANAMCVRARRESGTSERANPVNFPNNLARHAGIIRNGVRRQRGGLSHSPGPGDGGKEEERLPSASPNQYCSSRSVNEGSEDNKKGGDENDAQDHHPPHLPVILPIPSPLRTPPRHDAPSSLGGLGRLSIEQIRFPRKSRNNNNSKGREEKRGSPPSLPRPPSRSPRSKLIPQIITNCCTPDGDGDVGAGRGWAATVTATVKSCTHGAKATFCLPSRVWRGIFSSVPIDS